MGVWVGVGWGGGGVTHCVQLGGVEWGAGPGIAEPAEAISCTAAEIHHKPNGTSWFVHGKKRWGGGDKGQPPTHTVEM